MIPVATTTITVLRRPSATVEAYGVESGWSAVATGVRAVLGPLGSLTGRERVSGASQSAVQLKLTCDPLPSTTLLHTDRVVEGNTTYAVTWAAERRGLGLDHITARLLQVEGVAE